ncbi:hypothetical protein H6768_00040 [Candidatus Peribacteria bacterium]|nr:hypothetical protein [Candidatus Peribacteria bacterium]
MKLFSDLIHIILNISWVADISGMLVAIVIGIIWYNPRVFGRIWVELV